MPSETSDADAVTLAPLDAALVRAQLERSDAFFDRLGAPARSDWPPPLYDDDAMQWFLARLEAGGDPAWHLHAVMAGDEERRRVVGVAGFKGAPDAAGEVEIGYSVIEAEQRRGYGGRAVARLLTVAFADPRVALVSAHTLASGVTAPSRRVLERAGFAGPAPTDEEGVVRYELRRADAAAARYSAL